MDVKIIKFPIRKGKLEKWISWCEEVQERKVEAMKTLKREGVIIESFLIDDHFAYILMISEDHNSAIERVDADPLAIDIDHRKNMKDCLDIENYEYLKNVGNVVLAHLQGK